MADRRALTARELECLTLIFELSDPLVADVIRVHRCGRNMLNRLISWQLLSVAGNRTRWSQRLRLTPEGARELGRTAPVNLGQAPESTP